MAQVGSNSSGSLYQTNLNANGILYATSAGVLSNTTVGTSGQVLTSNGAGVAPTFQPAAGGGGGWVLIQSQVASNSAALTFNITNTYNNFALLFSGYTPTNGNTSLLVQINSGGGFLATGYNSGCNSTPYNSATWTNTNSTTGLIMLKSASTTQSCSGLALLNNFTSGVGLPNISGYAGGVPTTGMQFFGGSYSSAAIVVTSFQIVPFSIGNLNTGTFTLFGILE